MECDAVRCGTKPDPSVFKAVFLRILTRINIQNIHNRMRFADLNATAITNMELFYVTLYRLVIKVSDKFDVFFYMVQGFLVGSRPPTEIDPLTNRCENQKTPG